MAKIPQFAAPNIQRPMTLIMPLADPSYPGLLALGEAGFGPTHGSVGHALDMGGTVHFARFAIIGHNLAMVSSYDGYFEDYIQMFIHTLGDTFDDLMKFIADAPPLPVRQHPGEFVDWVMRHNVEPIGFYSGYKDKSVQQIREALDMKSFGEDGDDQHVLTDAPQPLPEDQLDDIQGLILRGFGQAKARHFIMSVNDPATARAALAKLAEPADGPDGPVRVSAGAHWGDDKPDYGLAVGLTARGLLELGVDQGDVATFPTEFLAGAPARAPKVGDWGASSPEYWHDAFQHPDATHVLFSLYASDDAIEQRTHELMEIVDGPMHVIGIEEAAVFADAKDNVHFGYRDNISQPIIAGDPVPRPPDDQPLAAAGEFVLGYESQYVGVSLEVPQPPELGHNGSFSAFRVMAQDVVGFEKFLDDQGSTTGLGKEKLAAKLVGRWRNGVPLILSPDTDNPSTPITEEQWNAYKYQHADPDGAICPLGSHMRRANPRDQTMTPVGDGHARRIMRRGMPYGPAWSAGDAPDDVERGLTGHFIGASLVLQFETIMGEWINQGMTKPEITGTNDVVLGVGMPGARCPIPTMGADGTVDPNGIEIKGIPQFTTTRGCIYAFLPSMTALRWLGSLS